MVMETMSGYFLLYFLNNGIAESRSKELKVANEPSKWSPRPVPCWRAYSTHEAGVLNLIRPFLKNGRAYFLFMQRKVMKNHWDFPILSCSFPLPRFICYRTLIFSLYTASLFSSGQTHRLGVCPQSDAYSYACPSITGAISGRQLRTKSPPNIVGSTRYRTIRKTLPSLSVGNIAL